MFIKDENNNYRKEHSDVIISNALKSVSESIITICKVAITEIEEEYKQYQSSCNISSVDNKLSPLRMLMDEISKNQKNERSLLISKAGQYLANNCRSNDLSSEETILDTDTQNVPDLIQNPDLIFTMQPIDDYLYDLPDTQ